MTFTDKQAELLEKSVDGFDYYEENMDDAQSLIDCGLCSMRSLYPPIVHITAKGKAYLQALQEQIRNDGRNDSKNGTAEHATPIKTTITNGFVSSGIDFFFDLVPSFVKFIINFFK